MWRDYMCLARTLTLKRDARETERQRQIINSQAPQAGKGGNGGGKVGNGGMALLCGFCRSNREAADV
ncbi:unnamed protein product [Merluccius merluccius]